MITTELKIKNTGTVLASMKQTGTALSKKGNKFGKIFEALGPACEMGGKVFAAIGVIQVLTGTDEMSQLKRQLDEMSKMIKSEFKILTDKLDVEFARVSVNPALNTIDACYKLFDTYSLKPESETARKDVANIKTQDVMVAVTALKNAVVRDDYFNKISGFYGNSPDVVLNRGMRLISALTKGYAVLVATTQLNRHNFDNVKPEKQKLIIEEIIDKYDKDFRDGSGTYLSQILQAMTLRIGKFDPERDVRDYFERHFKKLSLKAGDHHNNCQTITTFLNSNYPSRAFHAFITYYETNIMYKNLAGKHDSSFGFVNFHEGVMIISKHDAILGTALGGRII